MKKLFFFFSIMLLPLIAIAQDNNDYEAYMPKVFEFKHAVGGAASRMSGYGISYQYHITPKNRLEATAFMLIDTHEDLINDDNNESSSMGSFGLEYHHLLASKRKGKLFLMFGAGYDFDQKLDDYDDYSKRIVIGGGGFVVEVYLPTLNITLNLDIGLTYRYKMNYENDIHISNDKYFGLGAGCGIYYTF